MSEKRQITTHTNEFKKSAVELAIRSNSVSQTAQDLGVNKDSVFEELKTSC
ncbi:hypothetical protein ACQZV8_05250 [Magnetococcales bacterium HHB-1]